MKKQIIFLLLTFIFIGCKTTGIHIIDNPDGTSVKISYWEGNSQDNQGDILQIGNRGKLMKVTHNLSFMTKYDEPLIFDLENGQSVTLVCNKSDQKRDYNGILQTDFNGNPSMECLEHKVTKTTVQEIKIGAKATFGV